MNRIVSSLAVLGVVAALAPAAMAAEQGIEKKHVSVATASVGLPYLPLVLSDRLGYFKDEGLEVEISAFSGGSKALEALVGGSVDVVSGAYSHTINMATKGQYLKTFVVQVRYPALTVGVAKAKTASFKSIKDMKGMKVGVSAPGSSTHMVLSYILSRNGLKPDDVAVIGVGTSAGAIAAIRSGQIDAIINSDPVMTTLEAAGDVIPVAETRTTEGTMKALGGPYPEAGLYTMAAFIDKNPHTVQALTNAIVRAEKWLQKATPDDVANAVPKEYLLNNRELYINAFKKMRTSLSPDGLTSPEGAKTVYDVLAAFLPNVKAAKIDLASTYDNRFVEKALAKYK
jgi:NitT/TauT family transport system substrate-binding protein